MKRILLAAVIGLVVVALGYGVLSRTQTVVVDKSLPSRAQESQLDNAREALRRGADNEACQTAIQALNHELGRNSAEGPAPLSEAQKKLLTEKFYLDAGELAEVDSRTFTNLDANYLETCFFISDGLRALQVDNEPLLGRVQAAFAWISREVRLREKDRFMLPPRFVLSRGWGSSLERASLFSAVATLLGVDSCMIAVPYGGQEQRDVRYWIPGALVEGQIYLFDTRMGMPIPGPNGQGIATLAQARSQPGIIASLTVDPKFPYDVNAESLKRAEVHVAGSLSMLSPRMAYLQVQMSSSDRINVAVDPEALLKRFEKALEAPELKGVPLQVWNHPGELNTPFRSLRLFLPRDEGGTDKSSPSLRQQARMDLVPWNLLPPEIGAIPGEIGSRLKSMYGDPFYCFAVEPKASRLQLQAWLPGLMEAKAKAAIPGTEGSANQRQDIEVIFRGRLPRELMLRGKFDEASSILATMEGELRRQRQEMASQPNLLAAVRDWAEKAVDFYGSVLRATNASGANKGKSTYVPNAEEIREREMKLMEDSRPVQVLIQGTAAGPLIGEVIYFLALCKHEQAERLQAHLVQQGMRRQAARSSDIKNTQKAWESAAGWWNTYLSSEIPLGTPAAARTNLARARFCLGDKPAARSLLEDLGGELTPLEKTGRLYQAKQIK